MAGATMSHEPGTGDTGVAEATPASRAALPRRDTPQDPAAAARSPVVSQRRDRANRPSGTRPGPKVPGWLDRILPHLDPAGLRAASRWRPNPARSVVLRLNRPSRTRLSAFIVRIMRAGRP